jgi:alginate O-acetyltransferase complex protein AlgF
MISTGSRVVVAAVAILSTAPAAIANDGQLYKDVTDPNASFVRVVSPGASVAVVSGESFDTLEGGFTPFVVVDAGEIDVLAGDVSGTVSVEPSSYYSFIVGADGTTTTVKDQITNNPAQADLVFYNLSDIPSVDLYVPQAKAVAVGGVPADESGSVALKAPLTLDFEVREGETQVATISGVELKRRAGVTILLTGSAGNYEAVAVENRYVN